MYRKNGLGLRMKPRDFFKKNGAITRAEVREIVPHVLYLVVNEVVLYKEEN